MDSSAIDDYEASSDNYTPAAITKPSTKTASKRATSTVARKPTKKMTQLALAYKTTTSKKRPNAMTDDELSELDGKALDEDSQLETTPPKEKKQSKPRAKKAPGSKPLQTIENEVTPLDVSDDVQPKKTSGATERYQKLTQLEHILKRPDTYIGSVERTEKQMWVYNSQTDSMEMREVSFVPGLYKIFDEILVNAADNKQRDKKMNAIEVTIDREKGEISVWNNGRGIPIEIHEKERIHIPEMIFGHLLTSSNYDDDQQKVTGGRNGYGAKLCNIFSTEFKLETADSQTKQVYKQTWTNNMSNMSKASITVSKKKDDYTKITFKPDFKKFGMTGIDDDFEALVKRRVYDLAGTIREVKVVLNGDKVPIRNFKQYVEMYVKSINKERGEESSSGNPTILTEQPDPRWEIGFAVSDGSFQQVSFVNSIATTSGGTHVNYVGDQIVNRLMDIVKKKNKGGAALKNHQIRNHIFLFVNCLIVNPAFTSQTKEQLTTKASQFGSKCVVSDEFLKKVAKTEAVTNILHFAQQKADQVLKKSDGGKRARINNPKLIDANKAGTKDGWKCTLILTEGDSAKALALAGRSVVGPDEFGVFPLRGKLLNVRDASIDMISKNAEIQSIKQFMGLQHKKEYLDTKSLRYGHIMIMTDQDHDGSHIKGLLINFLQCSFPSLLRIPQFLIEFITPIVKVWKGDPKHPTKSVSFFTMPEYEAWKEQNPHGWENKYYKGLGTSTTEDAQRYFSDLDRHLKEFHTMQEAEEKLFDLAFSKKKTDERKEWLRQFKPGTYLDHSIDKITYSDFVNKELILFSMADNMRSIPSVIDGLKPGQRKVLYTCFRRNLKKDMKVVELAGLVSGLTAYHHGETSLQQTIVGLAQTFVGSNNINCLEPSGNFGSRLQGGSDCASARYIYTRLSPFARRVFSQLDEPLLTYNKEENKQIEPEVYCPVVPMILINGADGIGTGWSSSIPNYNPEEVVANLKRLLNDEKQVPMTPWFRGWAGEVKQVAPERFKFNGIIRQTGENEVEITELPIRMWTQDFKEKMEDIIKAEKVPSFIKDYTDYNTHVKVHFIVQMDEKHMKAAVDEGLEEKFKLSKTLATSNLVAFNRHGRLHRYNNVEEIMEEFYSHRLMAYEKRKAHQIAEMHQVLEKMTNQARFIQMIIKGELVVSKKKKADLVAELKAKGFKAFPKVKNAAKEGELESVIEREPEGEDDLDTEANAYDYLLGMAIWSLTQERVQKLLQQIGDKEHEIDELLKLSAKDLWTRELDEFIGEWRFQLEDDAKLQKKASNLGRRASNKLKIGAKGPAAKKRKAIGEDPDDSDFEAAASKPKKAAVAKRAPPKPASSFFTALKAGGSPPAKQLLGGTKAGAKGDAISSVAESNKGKSTTAKAAKPTAAAAKASSASTKVDDSTSDTIEPSKPTPRSNRLATKKPVRYTVLSDDSDIDDNGDDMLGDVSKMVKGIGNNVTVAEAKPKGGKAFFSTTAPTTTKVASPRRSSTPPWDKHNPGREFSVGEVDGLSLSDGEAYLSDLPLPKPKEATRSKRAAARPLDEEDDEDDDPVVLEDSSPPKKKQRKTAATHTAAAAAGKATTSKAKPKSAPVKKAAKGAAPPPPSKKPLVSAAPAALSPAAKAYASKRGKKRAIIESDSADDDDDDDGDDFLAKPRVAPGLKDSTVASKNVLADRLLASSDKDDEDDEEAEDVLSKPAPARPARRAAAAPAAKKPKYVDSESECEVYGESDEDEEEEDYEESE